MPLLASRPFGTFRSILRFLPFLLPFADLFVTPASGQEPTWIVSPVNGNSYALTPPGSWEATQQWATSRGANLVTIRSAAEQEWLRATFASANFLGNWIGLNDFQTSRVWRWANGEWVTYTNWHPGEPNSSVERAALMYRDGTWNDAGASASFPGIAERVIALPNELKVWDIRAFQRPGTKILDIYYNLHHPLGFNSYVTVELSQDGGITYGTVPTMTGAFGGGITPGMNKAIEWRAATDWTPALYNNVRVRITADDGQEMRLIPGGTFEMGYDVYPTTTVNVSPFYILRTEVTLKEWRRVQEWAVARGYTDLAGVGQTDAENKPVTLVNWYHVIQWLNAKSEMEGLTPLYFSTADRLELYRRGVVEFTDAHVNWSANGYRLPTEAEWEKAARGGVAGNIYPTGNTITTAQADFGRGGYGWGWYWSNSVASYPPNRIGLFDVAGNVWEWCWDRWGDTLPTGSDPRGPAVGGHRILRGGSYPDGAESLKLAGRNNDNPGSPLRNAGFRYVRNATP
jgi:sulfatase modifying factor 1